MWFQKGVIVKNVPITLCNFRYSSASWPTQNYTVFEQKISFYNILSAGPYPQPTQLSSSRPDMRISLLFCPTKNAHSKLLCAFSVIRFRCALLGDLHDRDLLAILAQALKFDLAVLQSEQGVIAALAHIDAGMDVGAALADQDVAGQNELTVRALDAEPLGLGIAAVTGGADALLVGEELKTDVQHCRTPPNVCR